MLITEVILRFTWGNGALFDIYGTEPIDGRCTVLKPGASVQFTGLMHKIPMATQEVNKQGFRGPERPFKKPEGVYRIAMIGDSFTYGYAVSSQNAIPALVEKRLRSKGFKVEVMNFGVPGYEIEDMATQLKVYVSRWHPDLVLVDLFHGPYDLDRSECYYNQKYAVVNGKKVFHDYPDIVWRIIKPSYFLRSLGFLVFGARRSFVQEQEAAKGIWSPEKTLRSGLKEFSQWTKANRVPIKFLVLEDLLVSAKNPKVDFQMEMNRHQLQWFDLGEALNTMKIKLEKIPNDGHYVASSNKVMSRFIADWLMRDVLISQDCPGHPSICCRVGGGHLHLAGTQREMCKNYFIDVIYAQEEYFAKHKRYAKSFNDLKEFPSLSPAPFYKCFQLIVSTTANQDSYELSAPMPKDHWGEACHLSYKLGDSPKSQGDCGFRPFLYSDDLLLSPFPKTKP